MKSAAADKAVNGSYLLPLHFAHIRIDAMITARIVPAAAPVKAAKKQSRTVSNTNLLFFPSESFLSRTSIIPASSVT